MPIPISIAMLIALFTLGAAMKNKKAGNPDEVVIIGGKQVNWVNKKDSRTLVVMAPEQQDHTITIQGQQESAFFDNIFQCSGLYKIIKDEPMTAINNSINSNIKQAIALSPKE
ncbi:MULTISPECIES: hypothetical protein [Niastella]|uniref:DUF4369 domain-containing protein n=1 Tax=Niastella soli TaxID=2821487 RepID=A0ABS3YPK0_9BACT|nr:hypothetical protein [Niastella soli]MBO9199818.1 hypothetical protein [Niastella soli]